MNISKSMNKQIKEYDQDLRMISTDDEIGWKELQVL